MIQCKFCTKTPTRHNKLFKGILNSYICEECILHACLFMANERIKTNEKFLKNITIEKLIRRFGINVVKETLFKTKSF